MLSCPNSVSVVKKQVIGYRSSGGCAEKDQEYAGRCHRSDQSQSGYSSCSDAGIGEAPEITIGDFVFACGNFRLREL
jgi:hypothetical protein